jgi:DNA polymerase III subunit delta'
VIAVQSVVGQEYAIQTFNNALDKDKISHAYIISGPDGVGKSNFALSMAAAILCKGEKRPCNKCSSCTKIEHKNHPDLRILENKGKTIGVDDIRNLIDEIYTKPYEGDKKIAIIKEAHSITLYGQNAILKTLEEPPGHTVIIMLTENINAILETIKSRCQIISLGRVSIDKIKNFLKDRGIEDDKAGLAAEFSDGIVGNALKALDEKFLNLKKEVIERAQRIVRSDAMEAFELVDFFIKNKNDIDEILDILTIWFRDIMLLKLVKNEKLIINKDCHEMLVEESHLLSYNKLDKIISIINDTKEKLRQYSNFQLTMEVMILKIQEA